MSPKWVIKNATVFVLDDQEIAGQCILAVSSTGIFFLAAPGDSVRGATLDEMKKGIASLTIAIETKSLILEAIEKHSKEPPASDTPLGNSLARAMRDDIEDLTRKPS